MKKVGEITHEKSGITVPIFLEKFTFVCTVLEKKFEASDAAILRVNVRDFIDHWLSLDWHPMLKVELARTDGWGNSKKNCVGVAAERMYLSRSPGGQLLYVNWDTEPVHRKSSCHSMTDRDLKLVSSLPFGAPLKAGSCTVWMDYTEAKWQAITQIQARLNQLADELGTIISTTAGNARLEAWDSSRFLLPAT